ncbi:MAG: segregation/condensation protein A, partial [Lachnospiraceae bacterium]|nr:segregation/condensation protein A [Lachnospiraceae bacterium]
IRRQADRVDPIRSSFGTIKKEEVRLSDRVIFVADFAKEHGSFSFAELLLSDNDRIVTIVTFLAVLELMKYGIVEASQEEIAGDILIRVVEGADIASVDLESDFEGAS